MKNTKKYVSTGIILVIAFCSSAHIMADQMAEIKSLDQQISTLDAKIQIVNQKINALQKWASQQDENITNINAKLEALKLETLLRKK
jgi:peptidoglycan hydrolase CwlO-like protein